MEQDTHHTTPALGRQPVTVRPISPEETYALRHAVLWPDKPISYVQLPEDLHGQHFGAFTNSDNESNPELVSIISLFVDDSGEARFRKFATAPKWQGIGIGSVLLKYTIEAAVELGATRIWCDARETALGFYQRFGMSGEGAVFFKSEVPYLRMSKPLP
ncbi:GCN5-like N-acetyltransferase [Hypoxylon sp. FL1150]|nr:GCN5-like N-acetyltransferase [Hypoxylon sp. FL1150]